MSDLPKLSARATACIISLHNLLPQEQLVFWVTVDEIRQRLVEGGVSHSLTREHISNALRLHNRGQKLLEHRREATSTYYRPCSFEFDNNTVADQRKSPSGRRLRGLAILPPKQYFFSNVYTISMVWLLNDEPSCVC